jgi:hypothetical protein
VDTVDNAVVANCTLSRNVGTDGTSQGGGIHIEASSVDIDNSIFWENEDASGITYTAQIFLSTGSYAVDTSCFTDPACPSPIGTNMCDDPLFVDPDGPSDECGTEYDDLTLSDGSPCINEGNDSAVPWDLTDLDNDGHDDDPYRTPLDLKYEDRFVDTVDMGAYEHQVSGGCPADFDDDGDVDTADLLFLLGAWGTPDGDVDGDGDTDTGDLLALLAAWGECP